MQLYVKDHDYVIAESAEFDYIRIYPDTTIKAPEGKTVTMVINGQAKMIRPGEYKGDIKLIVKEAIVRPFKFDGDKPYIYRTGLYIKDNQLLPEKSVQEAVLGAVVTANGIDGVMIKCHDYDFNGIMVEGESDYKITNSKIEFLGNGTNDFMGMGFGIMVTDNSKLLIEDCDIHTKGVVRGTVYASGTSELTVKHSNIWAETTDELPIGYKQHIGLGNAFSNAWVLGTLGSCRASFFTEKATVNIIDCVCKSQCWGILSVDMPMNVTLNVKDSIIEKTGESAYGAFSIGACVDTFDNCYFPDVTFAMVMSSNEASGVFKNHTKVNARIGVITYRNYQGTLEIKEGCVFNTEKACICVKGSSSLFKITDSEFHSKNGVFFQLMDNDEQPNADGYYVDPLGEEDIFIEGRDITEADPTEDVMLELSDMRVDDNIFNGSTNLYVNQRCPQFEMPWSPPPGPKHHGFGADLQGAKNLDVNMKNVECNGLISSSWALHESPTLTAANYYEIGVAVNTVQEPVNNGVIVHMDKDCVWTVPGECWITGLHLEEGAVMKAPAGKKLEMYIDGIKTEIKTGNYKGKINLVVA